MIVLYVLDGCPYCERALRVLNENNIKHRKIVVENTDEQKKYYKKLNKMDTFPQIFIQMDKTNRVKVGGSTELIENLNICENIKNSNCSIESIFYMFLNLKKNKKSSFFN